MPEFQKSERVFMQRALELACNGRFSAHPNPMVGCVLVKDGNIVGEGWHEVAGEAHAEVIALQDAGGNAQGATAYVTLEPCAHHGKTPPCCEALIAAGVTEVVFARHDPNPKVDGAGAEALTKAGIGVRTGLMQAEVEALLAGFLCRIEKGRPRVRLKIACSLDGRIAMADGESRWITGAESRADVQRLRAVSGAILAGIGTVLADDPALTVRDTAIDTRAKQPLRVILDSQLRMPPNSKMLQLDGATLVCCCDKSNAAELLAAGAEVLQLESENDQVDIAAVLQELGRRQVNDLLVEAGPQIAGRMLEKQLVDEIVIYQAPHILGSETLGMVSTPNWTQLADRQELQIIDTLRMGTDTRITARSRRNNFMFTGIVQATGTITALDKIGGDMRMAIQADGLPFNTYAVGESIAVNGACLTATALREDGFDTDVSTETLAVTTLGELGVGSTVNLEPSLSFGARLGGHLVSGHVDCIGTIVSLRNDARSIRLGIEIAAEFARYVARKGSICIDGVSLTINAVSANTFDLNIIPHTVETTIIGNYSVGSNVNIEVDLLARYIERLLDRNEGGLTMDFLKANGYV